jgi:hypothetical protein
MGLRAAEGVMWLPEEAGAGDTGDVVGVGDAWDAGAATHNAPAAVSVRLSARAFAANRSDVIGKDDLNGSRESWMPC